MTFMAITEDIVMKDFVIPCVMAGAVVPLRSLQKRCLELKY